LKIKKIPANQVENVKGLGSFTLFEETGQGSDSTKMGYVVFTPGTRVPKEGHSSHLEDEFAYIISGGLKCCSGGINYEVISGDSTFIPAGEEHYSYNDSDEPCTLVYFLSKK
jgi:quercetin dioxygenase-like cupin family protein